MNSGQMSRNLDSIANSTELFNRLSKQTSNGILFFKISAHASLPLLFMQNGLVQDGRGKLTL